MLTILLAGLIAFILTVIGIPFFIKFYQAKKIAGQQMHEDVKQHLAKAGTPTMGGTVFILVATLVTLAFSTLSLFRGAAFGATAGILSVVVIYGIIGFLDDFLKIFK